MQPLASGFEASLEIGLGWTRRLRSLGGLNSPRAIGEELELAGVEADAGVLTLQYDDRVRHEVDGRGFGCADRDVAAHQTLKGLDLIAGTLEIAQGAADVGCEGFAGGRQADTALQPVKQDRADLLFEIEDAPVERRGSNPQCFSGPAYRAVTKIASK
jgi:hypothetical protein